MNKEFFDALDLLEKEKGIPKAYMIEKIEAALLGAFKKEQGGNGNIKVVLDPEKKDMKVYAQKEIVETVEDPMLQISLEDAKKISRRYKIGGIADIKLDPKKFRRLSATNAKQIIIQGIREAERNMRIKEYEDKKEEIISALIQRVDEKTGDVILDTGNGTATLFKSEQIPGERFTENERVKVFVMEVKKEEFGPIVTLSRTHPGMIKRLFEMEVPEIQDGTVVIMSVSREAGSRTKIAVQSRDENVDPIGACIGNKGMRISEIVEELNGEKIDIVKYSENIEEYVRAALSPANVRQVIVEGERSCKVLVDEDQFSLAIGKEGQNARLAARLTGYRIDIKTEL